MFASGPFSMDFGERVKMAAWLMPIVNELGVSLTQMAIAWAAASETCRLFYWEQVAHPSWRRT
ncbi:hypothetical protein JG687_00000924 [Phytophthora cactorum]|uniref:Uncharacterized protein n=1 Tax=Phytophthora cactorum TaxID=29920 RepID=A0A8T1UZF3_9STRA|nr:hypothetical protein JG687_00000924 [Phytophthora cactorum]